MRGTSLAFVLAFLPTACVTVHIYFPAAAVQKAADRIVDETWGEAQETGRPTSQIHRPYGSHHQRYASLTWVSPAFAQEADINVSNPAIRAIKARMKQHSTQLQPFMDAKKVGINRDGFLQVLDTAGLGLKERAEVNQLVEAENRDRQSLYQEIARANNFPNSRVNDIQKIFARSWRDQAKKGWSIQSDGGQWTTR